MKREELLNSEGYWIAKMQTDLYRQIVSFMKRNNMNSSQLAEYLGCSKGYVSQLLNGNFDHKISKLVQLSLAMSKVPVIEYKDISDIVSDDLPAQSPQIKTNRQRNRFSSERRAAGRGKD